MVQDMTQGSPLKIILFFTGPLLLGNVFQQFYNVADMIIVGQYLGMEALAAVGATAPLFLLFFSVTIGLTSGFSIITGQFFGAHDKQGVRRSIAASLILTGICTLFLTVIVALVMPLILQYMNVSEELFNDAYHYIIIVTYGLIAMAAYNQLACISRALGDSRTPLYFLILSSVLNVVLAVFLVSVCHTGVAGPAVALIISQGVSAILCFMYMIRRFPAMQIQRSDWKLEYSFVLKHLKMGIPLAGQLISFSIGTILVQTVCNTFGADTIASFVAVSRLEQVAEQPMISFGIALSAYTAQNYGARKYERIWQGVWQCSCVSLLFCACMATVMYGFGRTLSGLFTTEPTDIFLNQAWLYLRITVPFYLFLGQIAVYRNALQGMGIASIPLVSSLIEMCLRGVSAFYLAVCWGYAGLCWGSSICWVAACLFTGSCYYFVYCHHRNHKELTFSLS